MNLNYHIHWVDDDTTHAESVFDGVKLSNAGELNLTAEIVESGEGLQKIVKSRTVDLVVLDYKLDNQNGDELISVLRGNGELCEIIFYSNDSEIFARCKDFENVIPCEKGDAKLEINRAIERFRDRCSNVSIMRGIVISEAIDLENELTDIILSLFGEHADLFRNKILNKPYLDFSKKFNFLQSVLNDAIAKAQQENSPTLESMKTNKEILKALKKDVIEPRNILAHSEKTFEDGVLTLKPLSKNESPIRFDEEWINNIRKHIGKHLENLSEIAQLLRN